MLDSQRMSFGAGAMAGLLVTVLLLTAGVLLGILLLGMLSLGLIMLVSGQWTAVLLLFLLFGLPVLVPGGLAVVALRLLGRKRPVAACLVAALSAGLALLVFLVANHIR